MKVVSRLTFTITTLIFAVNTCGAMTIISDDFDSYALGNIDGLGGWVDFGGTLPADVSDVQASSGTQSLRLSQNSAVDNGYGSDVFQTLPNSLTSGVYEVSYDLFISSDFDGNAHMFMSEGDVGAGEFDFGIQLVGDVAQGFYISFDGANAFGLPLITDAWATSRTVIDLDNNEIDVFYNDELLYLGPWDPNNSGFMDPFTFGSINVWADSGNGSGSAFVDNLLIQEVPEPVAAWALALSGICCLVWRRNRR